MTFYLCKEPSGMFRLCINKPHKRKNYWCPINDYYFNVSGAFNSFPEITTNQLIQINVEFTCGNAQYVTVDKNKLYHIWFNEPKHYSIQNSKTNTHNEFWDGGKMFMVCPETFGKELFPNVNINNFICIELIF